MLKISKELFYRWNSESVRYCHWKSNEHLNAGLDGETDLDILLSQNDAEKATEIFKDLDFVNCKSQYGSRYPSVTDWLGFDKETGRLIHVHLHYHIVTGHRGLKEYNLPWSKEALETRVNDKMTGVYVMEPNLELITLYTRIGLKANSKKILKAKKGKYKLSQDTQREIDYLKVRINEEELNKLLQKIYPQHYQQISSIIEKKSIEPNDFLKLIEIAEKTMQPYSRYNRVVGCFLKHYYASMMLIRKKIKIKFPSITRKTLPTGLKIAFMGQDGAGKSTVTADIEKWLSWKLDVSRCYLGSGDNYRSWQRSLQEKLPPKKSIILSFISALLTLSKYKCLSKDVLKTIKKAEGYCAKGGIAIFDRYPQTKYYGINDGPKIRALNKKTNNPIMRHLIDKYAKEEESILKEAESISPDILFKLILPPEESIKRKPNEDLEKVKQKHDIIKNLMFADAKTYEIDATADYQQELLLIKNLIWQNIQK